MHARAFPNTPKRLRMGVKKGKNEKDKKHKETEEEIKQEKCTNLRRIVGTK